MGVHMRRRLGLASAAAALLLAAAASAALAPADYAALAAGVGTARTGSFVASRMVLWGGAPTAVAADDSRLPVAVVAAATLGSGRIVIFGHEGMFRECCGASGLPRLLGNAALWAGAPRRPPGGPIRVASEAGDPYGNAAGMRRKLVAQFPAVFADAGAVPASQIAVAKAELFLADGQSAAAGQYAWAIRQFLRAGGGVVLGAQTWWWSQGLRRDAREHPANQLLMPLGLALGDAWEADATLHPTQPPLQAANLDLALTCLAATFRDVDLSHPCYLRENGDVTAALYAVRDGMGFVPWGGWLWQRLRAWEPLGGAGIDPARPVARKSPQGLAAFARAVRYAWAPAAQLGAAPDATHFPGLPPAGTKPAVVPLVRTVEGSTADEYWQALGAYALPGQLVNVTVPARLVATGGATLHIGGWTDLNYHKIQFARLPEVVRAWRVTGATTQLASPFGGLLFLTVPADKALGRMTVAVAGAIPAPVFQAGVTTPQVWAAQLARHVAPWGEFGTSKFVVASPLSSLRRVTDPAALAAYWDKVVDAMAWMAALPPGAQLPYPERMQHDVQISDGYMHAGYPIMTLTDVVNSTLDPGSPEKWGHFHELGHNFQDPAWTWGCTTEVTVNFFSVHAMFTVQGMRNPADFYGWKPGATGCPAGRYCRRQAHFAAMAARGAQYDAAAALCKDPALALDSFLQVSEDLSPAGSPFQLLRDTIASYARLPAPPQGDAAKLGAWVAQQSAVARRNLGPYYASWGWPLDAATLERLGALGLPVYKAPGARAVRRPSSAAARKMLQP